MDFLPFVRISLKSLIRKPYDFEPKTIGDHIKRKRLKMGLTQKEVASMLSISSWTILNWEKGYSEPAIMFIPIIVKFLGYDPFPKLKTLPQHLFDKR